MLELGLQKGRLDKERSGGGNERGIGVPSRVCGFVIRDL